MSDRYYAPPLTADVRGFVPNLGLLQNLGVRGDRGRLSDLGLLGWTPAQLFGPNDVGLWYDYAAITPEMLAWRKNLLLNSEFAGAVAGTPGTNPTSWTNSTSTGTIVSAAPGAMRVSAVAGRRNFVQSFTLAPNEVRVLRIDVDITTTVAVNQILGGFGAAVAVSEYFVDGVSFPNPNALPSVGQRTLAVRVTANATGGSVGFQVGVGLQANATADITFLNAQLTLGPSITEPYQRITDFTSDFVAAFPTTAIYQDSTGVTPVTALGQPVGLVLDKSRGGLNALGPELVVNGDFSVDANWTKGTGWTIAGGVASASGTGTLNPGLGQSGVALVPGRLVRWSFTLSNVTAGGVSFRVYGSGGSDVLILGAVADGTYSGFYTVRSDATGLVGFSNGAGTSLSVDNVSVREVPGNHAIQSTPTARPVWDARKNLLLRTEEFGVSPWGLGNATITANATTAPDGTLTADKLVEDTNAGNHGLVQNVVTLVAPYTISVYAKAAERSWVFLENTQTVTTAWFDLTNGVIGSITGAGTHSITSVGNGWFRCQLTVTATAATNNWRIRLATGNSNSSYTGDGTSGLFLWGAQLELGSTATTYQRVTTATDYADVGFSRGALFDGSDDFLVTAANLNLSGTDKVTVVFGVDKRSDSAFQALAETSANATTTDGTFLIGTSSTVGDAQRRTYVARTRGTVSSPEVNASVYAAPCVNVFTSLLNNGGTGIAGQIGLRVDGASPTRTESGTATSAGNFTSQLLYLGRRAGLTLPFNGRITQLIIIGRVLTTAELAQVERYVANQSGVLIP